MKIAVYGISKNEEKHVERFCRSAAAADYIVIADTGSTDNTLAIARECGATAYSICITPWRFDLARNAALALVPGDADVCVSLDLDEVLQPGWREEVERCWKEGTTRLRYYFDWGHGKTFRNEKIHARHGYNWHHPVHETARADGRITEAWAETDKLMIRHLPDASKSRGQYLPLLELSVREDPDCPRNAFYLGREYTYYSRWQDAKTALGRYLAMPGATWKHERCFAYRLLGKCDEKLGSPAAAEAQYHRACAEAPETREPWCALSVLMYSQSRWAECYSYAMRALSIKQREYFYTSDPETWGHQPHDLASIAAWHLGLRDVSVAQAKLAVEKSPDDLRLRKNLDYVTQVAAHGTA